MKIITTHTLLAGTFLMGLAFKTPLAAQCGVPLAGGSAYNMFTMVDNFTNPVAVDKDLNTVVFIHRHNSNIFGGNSGNLRYDISTNGGTSWTTNQGVLNPQSLSPARYPSVNIYNPPGNTTPANAYIGYMAATTNPGTGQWNGVVNGVRKLNGTGNTENYNQPSTPSYLVPGPVVKGAAGVYWSMNVGSNGLIATGNAYVYKGVWNNSTSTINWNSATLLPIGFDQSLNQPFVGDYNIAFDPTGTYGWVSIMGEQNISFPDYAYHALFFKTIDGGNSWQGPIDVPAYELSCVTQSLAGTAVMDFSSDLAVDMYGNPHLLAMVGVEYSTYAYSMDYSSVHHLVDITSVSGLWTAYDVSNVKGGYATYNGSASGNVSHYMTPQIARSVDGSKLFFGWTDNSSYYVGQPNTSPDLFSRAFDVQQKKWTPIKNFTACNVSTAGKILFPHIAADVLEPSANVYKLAPVYAEFTSAGDPDSPVNFKFIDNATFLSTDFSINQPAISVNIVQGSSALLCPGSALNLQINGSYSEVLWSNGYTGNTNQVTNPGLYTVGVRSGCLVAGDSITVNTVSINIVPSSSIVCAGSSVTLSVSGNAYSYSLSPSLTSGTTFTVFPTVSNNYFTILASGDQNCQASQAINIPVSAPPSVVAISNKAQLCNGETAVLQATGTGISLYSWSNGSTISSASVTPSSTTVYTITVINVAGCSTSTTITQNVIECVGINSLNKTNDLLLLYPNPSNGDVTIKTASDAVLQVVNELGQLVKTISLNSSNNHHTVMNGLPKGIYFVTGQSNGQVVKQKIIID